MRMSGWTPSIVPRGADQAVYLVVDYVGRDGTCVYREAGVSKADLETVIVDLIDGQYNDPERVVAFNTVEGWSRDVSAIVAREVRRRCDLKAEDVPSTVQDFVERHEGRERQLTLRLA
jgi:hypothetical protein